MRSVALAILLVAAPATARAAEAPLPGLEAALAYPFPTALIAAERADRIAWISVVKGVRNVWTATGPDYRARALTGALADDGQELTGLMLSPDGTRAIWVRGGDHDSNWPIDWEPNPADSPDAVTLEIWSAATGGGVPVKIAEGDTPAISAKGRVAFIKSGKVWSVDGAGKEKPKQLIADRGKASALAWSPDGTRLAFVSGRGDHSFVGIWSGADKPIVWLAPATGFDGAPVWSPDGQRVAFTRLPGNGGAPEPMLTETPLPWSIVVADATSGDGKVVWQSPRTLEGSYPDSIADGAALMWGAHDRLVFRAELDGWPHLYSMPAAGGQPLLLTPGNFMVEHTTMSRDRATLFYDANTGTAAEDDDRRHIFRVPIDRAEPVAMTRGDGLEWTPVAVGGDRIAFVAAGATRAAEVRMSSGAGNGTLVGASSAGYAPPMVAPKRVVFKAADGLVVHGQLFEPAGGKAKHPAIVFVHGGPMRQMLLGFPYMDYYAHSYAVNQYLASRGFVVLSVNYRLGIGYGRAFQHPDKASFRGASEYRDVQAGAKYLQSLSNVNPDRIGIWGGSYGGYLTALALARDSATFKAGVDLHGVHDWSRLIAEEGKPVERHEKGDWEATLKTAFESSPIADVARWKSPVLLIHGDDDRNVRFNQTIDLARRLDNAGVRYEQLILPNEIHGFLRYADWLKADTATVRFFETELKDK
ncbi:MAG: prolyl oligopeptidase family serine peptidase [Candidatus Sphingomonas colombiensis]|nr:prolyl oligopeptidase family serine peptidase [Sphingomonas sp.]WEK41640.1 MAG: prolyl oligopeptidase family serine peptidase [Sphingomonas sp.]